jgi:two-component system response regulator CpxR
MGRISMSIVALTYDAFTGAEEVGAEVANRLQYAVVTDADACARAAALVDVDPDRMLRLMNGPRPWIQPSEDQKRRWVAALRMTMVDIVAGDRAVVVGSAAYLISVRLQQVLRVGLVAPSEHRVATAEASGLAAGAARRQIERSDQFRAAWTHRVCGRFPWDGALHDVVIAMQDRRTRDAADDIVRHALNPALVPPEPDLPLAEARTEAEIALTLAREGHDAEVAVRSERALVQLTTSGLFADRAKREVQDILKDRSDLREVEVRLQARTRESETFDTLVHDQPPRVMLVDDERDFVDTLSERLQTREFSAPAIAYDGEQALEMVDEDQPEVMVLDLRMPGIDGLEVLRRVKSSHPETEVIILTGHGSDTERRAAEDLGAFAYLQKPVDLDRLTETMRAAHHRVQTRRKGTDASEASE